VGPGANLGVLDEREFFLSAVIDPPVRSARCIVTVPPELSAFHF